MEWRAAGRGEAGGGAERVPQQFRVLVLGGVSFLSLFFHFYYQVLFAVHPSAACCMQVLPNPQCYYRPRRSRPIVTHLPGISYAIWTTFPLSLPYRHSLCTSCFVAGSVYRWVLYPHSLVCACVVLNQSAVSQKFLPPASVVPGLLTSVFLLAGTDGPLYLLPSSHRLLRLIDIWPHSPFLFIF